MLQECKKIGVESGEEEDGAASQKKVVRLTLMRVAKERREQEKEKNEDVPDVTEQEVNESKEQQIKKGDSKPKYQYGNYNRYYGYRLEGSDPRMGYFNPDWFRNKDILDIGCNVGEVSCMINVHCLSSVKVLKCLKFTFSFAGDHGNC